MTKPATFMDSIQLLFEHACEKAVQARNDADGLRRKLGEMLGEHDSRLWEVDDWVATSYDSDHSESILNVVGPALTDSGIQYGWILRGAVSTTFVTFEEGTELMEKFKTA